MLHNAKHDGNQSGNPSTRSSEHIAPAVTIHVLQTRYKMSSNRTTNGIPNDAKTYANKMCSRLCTLSHPRANHCHNKLNARATSYQQTCAESSTHSAKNRQHNGRIWHTNHKTKVSKAMPQSMATNLGIPQPDQMSI